MKNRGAGLVALASYMRYVFNSVAKWNLALALIVPSLNVLVIVATIPPSPGSLTLQLVSITSFLYSIFSIVAAYVFASDLSRGTSTVFLSQPLTRRGYVVTWMLAVALIPAVAYLLSFVIPFVVMDVKLLASDPVDFLLLLLEGAFLSMVTFLTGLIGKRPYLVVAIGIFVHMILLYILALAYSLTYYSGLPSEPIAFVYAVLFPFKSKVSHLGFQRLGYPYLAVLTNLALSLTLVASALVYAKRKFEVK